MKKVVFIISFFLLIYSFSQPIKVTFAQNIIAQNNSNDQVIKNAFNQKISNIQVQNQGVVIKLLKDDLDGGKHQRFILKFNYGQTVLIAHNIDLAPRINNLKVGDIVSFYGEYEWNSQGGVVHWTHKDPQGKHPHGWLKHKGKTYQ
ncbi:MAG: DUF3465 domain-containing protein [Cyanobacteria bacterium]|nr:DUF3465 domain-containing protein [Cyanobacteria bacterium CG_2015-16_32_12]NCO77531.1 DUF3465 domain-containing protein [Cyanobacteria bacterium CG_2015-22_32_23]NCQ04491.1 DUF3465 domain-containing protein [Cyanobacteria bacterium CG_2015-09_32_10]NCQ42837.1 DUF3465 domain-containing protein [Cyanobacteria bacterium CG_2015-04_32_10]NCS84307.1 DUF3465 domain-containing protein [Cyanobacteria bacterium CG_2015-02_32_10]